MWGIVGFFLCFSTPRGTTPKDPRTFNHIWVWVKRSANRNANTDLETRAHTQTHTHTKLFVLGFDFQCKGISCPRTPTNFAEVARLGDYLHDALWRGVFHCCAGFSEDVEDEEPGAEGPSRIVVGSELFCVFLASCKFVFLSCFWLLCKLPFACKNAKCIQANAQKCLPSSARTSGRLQQHAETQPLAGVAELGCANNCPAYGAKPPALDGHVAGMPNDQLAKQALFSFLPEDMG